MTTIPIAARRQLMLRDLGLITETFDLATLGSGSAAWTAQQVRGSAVELIAGDVISTISAILKTAPTTPANLNKGNLAIYDTSARVWAYTADCSAAFQSGLDKKEIGIANVWNGSAYVALSSWTVPLAGTGLYYVCGWFDQSAAGGMPSLAAAGGTIGVGTAQTGKPAKHVIVSGQASLPLSGATLAVGHTAVYFGLS